MLAHYSDTFVLPLPAGHAFPMSKYRRLRERVAAEVAGVRLVEAPSASEGELALAHEPDWIGAVVEGTVPPVRQREIGFPWSPAMAERARRSVGATIAAARAALAGEGVAMNLAGGTHHAFADRGAGYCVFNDLAVTARLMQAEHHRSHRRLLRVALVDLDVHQGDGSAAIFRDDPTVFTLSLHGAKNFPARKQASDLDVELPDGCTDAPYLEALDVALAALWRHHAEAPPGLVLYLAGADPHEGDRLGRLKLTTAGLAERDRRVLDACRERDIPVAIAMGGGYGRDLEVTVEVQLNTVRAALADWRERRPRQPRATPETPLYSSR
ncbi:MAG TPA: histone deacetylase [Methylibium sp.]|uniref:histone deacetylase family protein n=1 Tax=Methylibium sp. TaxID=2067992 RepID=UPI002DB6D5DD|nr:histone deacetylase [Methylibium sp.]HEU4460008.1 histone deacetylase [Methylibium sp.]